MNLADLPLEVAAGISQNAVQSIASAPALYKPDDCAKSKTRATPRRIPGLSKTSERGYLNDDRELLGGKKKPGSLYAALMLGQLRRDFAPDKDGKPAFAQRVHEGHYWVAYSLTYWERQLGLTENEARSGVQCLTNSNGVVAVGKFRFGNEPKYQHFRLTEKALGYVPATPVAGTEEGGCVATTQGVCGNHTATTPTVLSPTVFESKPVDASPEATQSTVPPESQKTTGQMQESTPTPDAVEKPRKFSRLGMLFDETVAKHYPSIVALPEKERRKVYANLSRMKRRMVDAGYTYEQIERFVVYVAGDGWGVLRSHWTPEYNSQIHEKEKVTAYPDLRWLVGSPKHGTGAHRLEIALEVWCMDGGDPWPTNPVPKTQPAEPEKPFLTYFDLHPEELLEAQQKQAEKAAAESSEQSAMPLAEPAVCAGVAEAATCPPVVQVQQATPAPAVSFQDDDEQQDADPETIRKWFADRMAERETEARAKAERKYTADSNPYWKATPKRPEAKAKMAAAA